MQEGDESGLVVPIQIQRFNGNQSPINLSLRSERGEFSRFLRYDFDHTTILGESSTSLRMWLDVAAKPLQNQERRYTLTAEQQGSRIETTLFIDVVPVNGFGDIAWNAYPTQAPSHGDTLLANRALTRLNMTLRETGGILRGVLWHQGEADSNNPDCAYRYQENLQRLAERFRGEARDDRRGGLARDVNSDVPFIVATMSKGQDDRGDFSQFGELKTVVDTVHRNVSLSIAHADFVNNDDLRPPTYHCGDNSCVHFGGAAYREMGYRFYQALKAVWARDANN